MPSFRHRKGSVGRVCGEGRGASSWLDSGAQPPLINLVHGGCGAHGRRRGGGNGDGQATAFCALGRDKVGPPAGGAGGGPLRGVAPADGALGLLEGPSRTPARVGCRRRVIAPPSPDRRRAPRARRRSPRNLSSTGATRPRTTPSRSCGDHRRQGSAGCCGTAAEQSPRTYRTTPSARTRCARCLTSPWPAGAACASAAMPHQHPFPSLTRLPPVLPACGQLYRGDGGTLHNYELTGEPRGCVVSPGPPRQQRAVAGILPSRTRA